MSQRQPLLQHLDLTSVHKTNFPIHTWYKLIEDAEYVGFDTETTGLFVYDKRDHILGFSVAVKLKDGSVVGDYFPINHQHGGNFPEEVWRPFLELIVSKVLLIHNAVFDITVLKNIGIAITKYICTMKFAHLLNENRRSYSLDDVTLDYLGYKAKVKGPLFEMGKLAYGWDMPANLMAEYATEDAVALVRLLDALLERAKKNKEVKITKYWTDIEAPSIIGLTHMRGWGVTVDIDLCKQEEEKGLEEKERVTELFGFNPGSSIGLKKLLIDQLGFPVLATSDATGEPSFTKKEMERYDLMLNPLSLDGKTVAKERTAETDTIRELLVYRGWTKAVSGYYQSYQKHVSPDGRLRPEYKPHGTKTGRFACAQPNLQQIPKETNKVWNGAVKECLISANGYSGWEIDYAQLEFRLAASASRSENLLDIFSDPTRDIFDEMAKELGWARQATKGFTYTTLYGGGVQRIMDVFGVDARAAKELIEHFYSINPWLRAASREMSTTAKMRGFIDIWSGRRRHFQNPKEEYYKAFNSFIQGGAADIVKAVMIQCFREIVSENCRMLLQVHDSLWFEIKEGYESYYLPKIVDIMTRPSKLFDVRLDVDVHPWSKREELYVPENWEEAYLGKAPAVEKAPMLILPSSVS